jgi:uncharacterized protein (DUF2236 family)
MEHDGPLGPDSVAWRVQDHPAVLIGGLRALIIQSLHPLAMAGVAQRVKRVHKRVRGVDPVTGRPYSADDPDTQVWVHTIEWDSFLVAYNAFVRRLPEAEQDRYMSERVRIAALLGTPEEMVPSSVAELREYWERVTPELRISDDAGDAIGFVADPPVTRELLPYWPALRVLGQAAVAIVPRRLRRLAGIDRPRAVDVAAIATVRPLVAA